MIQGLLYIIILLGLISLTIGLLFNVKEWGITFSALSFALFTISSFESIRIYVNGLSIFDYALVWTLRGLMTLSVIIIFSKILQEINTIKDMN